MSLLTRLCYVILHIFICVIIYLFLFSFGKNTIYDSSFTSSLLPYSFSDKPLVVPLLIKSILRGYVGFDYLIVTCSFPCKCIQVL